MIHEEHLYIAGPMCFYPRGNSLWQSQRKEAEYYGAVVELPNDNWDSVPGDSIEEKIINNCDIILADLNDFYGYEPNADVSFECGMAFQLRKKMYAFMDDIGRMIDRVPNKGEENSCHDISFL